jgi:serine/threonine protein kinase
MENCNGGMLVDYLNTEFKNDDTFQRHLLSTYIYNIGSALIYLHRKSGIIHHDIKPQNIFLKGDIRANYVLKVGDFGQFSRVDETYNVTIKGTLMYIPIHLMQNNKTSDRRYECVPPLFIQGKPAGSSHGTNNPVPKYIPKWFIDWYSFFCIIYDILCNKYDYKNGNKNYYSKLVNEKRVDVRPVLSFNVNSITELDLVCRIIILIKTIELDIFLTYVDNLESKHYTDLIACIDEARTPFAQTKYYKPDDFENIHMIEKVTHDVDNTQGPLKVKYEGKPIEYYRGAEDFLNALKNKTANK